MMDPTAQSRPRVEPGTSMQPAVPQSPPAPRPEPALACDAAWAHGPSHAILWLTAGLGLAADLISKYLAFQHLPRGRHVELIRHVLSLETSLNRGALFGIGKGLSGLFIAASILAVAFVLYMFRNTSRRQWVTHLALGLVLAGALGNMVDRLLVRLDAVTIGGRTYYGRITPNPNGFVQIGEYPDGREPVYRFARSAAARIEQVPAVRDFIKFDIQLRAKSLWPWIFNLADAMLVVGVGVLLMIHWRRPARSASPPGPNDPYQPPT